MAARGAARKTYTAEEAAELIFDSDFSDRGSDFTDSGSDDEPESETEEEVIESENEQEQVMEIEFVADPIDNNQNNEAADGDANNDHIPEAPPVERFALPLAIVIEWKDQANDNYFASNNSQGTPGVHASVTDIDPLCLFRLYFTDELVDLILTQTNLYAQQWLDTHQLRCRSRATKSTPITKDGFMLYFAMILYRGVVWKPSYAHYYTENAIFATPIISKILSYNRFLLIEKFLHFVDNRTLAKNYQKIAKIKPVHDYLSQQFSLLYTPERDISIDESLLLWKGRLSWKQYIPKKRSRFSMKSFVLCEASSGYVCRSVLYTGKELTENLDTVCL